MTILGLVGMGFGLLLLVNPEAAEQKQERAREELVEGTRLYGARDYPGAQARFERSLELDPAQPAVHYLVARTIHAQYRPGDRTPQNLDRARRAIAAYQVVLASNPGQEEAWQAVAGLFGEIGEEDRLRDWIAKRAANTAAPAVRRADAYLALASRDLPCAQKPGEEASVCAARGLEATEKALRLLPESPGGWTLKASFLTALAAVAEARGADGEKVEYDRKAEQAQKRAEELIEKGRQESEAVKAY